VDAIVEYIQARRRKSGWGIWDVTLSLGEVLQKVGPTSFLHFTITL